MIQHIPNDAATIIPVDPAFTIYEYGQLGNGLSNGTVAKVAGRYPRKGWGFNRECDELVYVISGTGSIETPGTVVQLEAGSVAFIPKGEKIAWQGVNLLVFIPCIPAWTAEQHELVED
jgi:ethanolamine utilization protein EutQ (cupin superfamily)